MKKIAFFALIIFLFVALACNNDKSATVLTPDIYEWGQLDSPPAVLTYQSPDYPEALRRANITGQTLIEVTIKKTGKVEYVKILESSGNSVFDYLSLESAKTFVFEVPRVNGDSVCAKILIPFKFSLQ